jgi:hypothetical protein
MRALALVFSTVLIGCATDPASSPADELPTEPVEGDVSYASDVQPIWDAYCVDCHTAGHHRPVLDRGPDALLTTADSGCGGADGRFEYVVPGDPDASFLIYKLTLGGDLDVADPANAPQTCTRAMPETYPGEPLEDVDPAAVETIRRWIAQGALDN